MYFVTSKHPDYVLFCLTPSERAAVGLTEKQVVRLLIRGSGTWNTLREWPASTFSHTDFLVSLGGASEPSDPRELLRYLPPTLRD